jgi:HD-like signal output (HDOD) protein/signal transduction histidine kinase
MKTEMASEKINMYGLSRLPSFPHVIVKILETLQDELVDVSKLAMLIEMDGPLSAKLLTAANSTIYRRQHQIHSIHEAIHHMGWDMVKTLALSSAMHQIVNDLSATERFDLARFWRHSLYSAIIGKQLAEKLPNVSEDEAYLSGLLHDIGRLALRVNYPDQYKNIFDSKDTQAYLLFEESRVFGTNHCEVGSLLVQDWHVGTFLQDAIAFHHKPSELLDQTSTLVKIVHLAASMSESYPHILMEQLQNAKEWFNLDFQEIDEILTESNLQVHAMAASLNINIDDVIQEEQDGQESLNHLSKLNPSSRNSRSSQPELSDTNKSTKLLTSNSAEWSLRSAIFSTPPDVESPVSSIVAQTMLIDHLEKMINQRQDDSAFHTSLLHTAWMICGAKQILMFEADMANDRLVGKKTHQDQAWVEQFSFPLKHDVGMISDALLYRGVTDSFEQSGKGFVNLAEHQLMRLCEVDGMVCVPMLLGQKQLGVMVFAMDLQSAKEAAKNTFVIKALARIAAINLNLRNDKMSHETQHETQQENTRQNELDKLLHETSNPLSTIRNYLEILRRKASGNQSFDQDIRIVNDEIDRVTRLIRQFVESSSTSQDIPTNVNINQAILDVIALHESTYLKPVRIKTSLNLASELPEIVCNAYQLRQILINLIKNSAEAMPNGGELLISTYTEYMPGQEKWILINIQDTGVGIDDLVRAKIFGDIESAKGGEHKGLGLNIVADLVQGLGGKISFRSTTGVGTVFELRLPCASVS